MQSDDAGAQRALELTLRLTADEAVEHRVLDVPARRSGSFARRLEVLRLQLDQVSRAGALSALHLHGWEACMLGALAIRVGQVDGRVLCALRGGGPPWVAALVARVLRGRLDPFHTVPVASSVIEAETLSRVLGRSAEVLLHPVADAYFQAPRREDVGPCIVAQGDGDAWVDVVTRLCVLLNGREPRVRFSWLGEASPSMRAQLEAAHVHMIDAAHEREAAQALARSWLVFAGPGGDHLPLAQAMAAGAPCLACDTPAHRRLLHHGETGFICTSRRDFVEIAIQLLRHPAERQRVGAQARAHAARFTHASCRGALLRAYGLPATAPADHRERKEWIPLPQTASVR